MPITKSAIKRMRSDKRKFLRNQQVKSKIKTMFRKFTKTVANGSVAEATEQAREIASSYDQAASKGIIPKNRANRKKARVASALNKLTAQQAG